jgi:hypothetical protein
MVAAFLKDFFYYFFDGLYFFLFFTIFGFENHQVLLFEKVRKMVSFKLMFIFQDLLENLRRHFEGKAIHVLDIVSGPFIGSCLNLNHSIDLVRKEGSHEIGLILNASVALNVRIIRSVFHSGALVVAPSIAPGTFPHIISWFGFKTG